MKKFRLPFIAVLAVLLIGMFSGTGSAAIHWEGRAGQNDKDWFTADNWSVYAVPTSSDDVAALLVPGYGPSAKRLYVSLWAWDGELTVTETGNLSILETMVIGSGSNETGVLNNSGSIDIGTDATVGLDGQAILNMNAGVIDISGNLQLASGSGQGYINLRNGMIIANALDLNANGNAMINISEGELLIADINPLLVNSLILGGHIAAYGGWGTVSYDINQSHPGYITIYATDSVPTPGYVTWDNGGIGTSWDMPTNWDMNKTPRSVHDVLLTSDAASGLDSPVISEGTNATANTIIIGNGTSPDTPKLKMTGGSLDTTSTIYVGHQTRGIFDIRGGTVNTGTGWFIAGHLGGDGRVDISDGSIITNQLLVGYENGSDSLVKMTGGSLSCNIITIGSLEGAGRIELYGGTITTNALNIDINTSSVNITEGTLIINGDASADVSGLIQSGVLTGYGDPGNVICNYDITNTGKTTVTATAGKPCSESDLSGDCLIDFQDGIIFAAQWLSVGGCGGYDCGDLNDDLNVNMTDFAVLAEDWLISPALPRITAQSDQIEPIFYNTQTGETFTPQGSNYIPLDWVDGIPYHTIFNSAHYDATAAEEALSEMEIDGYNIVRVFIDPGDSVHHDIGEYGIAGPYYMPGADLYQPCLDNFIDFLRRARSHNIYVIPVCVFIPYSSYYWNLVQSNIPDNIDNMNIIYLSQGAIDAKKIYLKKLVQAVKDAEPDGALLTTVFSWELTNEVSLVVEGKPFNTQFGTVTPADGQTYDMAVLGDRQQCMDSGLINWANQCVTAVKSIDLNAMVSVSVFTYAAVGRTEPNGLLPITAYPAETRFPARPWSLLAFSTLSYVDVHMYPVGSNYSMIDDLETSEYSIWDQTQKPLLMGEYGAFKSFHPTIEDAVTAMTAHRQQARDLGFKGELFWTWEDNGQYQLWHMLEESEAINDALKPIQ